MASSTTAWSSLPKDYDFHVGWACSGPALHTAFRRAERRTTLNYMCALHCQCSSRAEFVSWVPRQRSSLWEIVCFVSLSLTSWLIPVVTIVQQNISYILFFKQKDLKITSPNHLPC